MHTNFNHCEIPEFAACGSTECDGDCEECKEYATFLAIPEPPPVRRFFPVAVMNQMLWGVG